MGFRDYLKKRKIKKFKKKYKVGLCLSGGGAKGFSYIGVFKAFEEYGIKFDAVAGTSIGSLFGAFYASGMSAEEIYKKTKFATNKDFRKPKLGFLPSKMDTMINNINQILPVTNIEQMKMDYYAVTVDIKTGKEKVFSFGDIATIVAGSCAIPGVFVPVKYKNYLLVDGGVTNNIPSDVLRMNGCDFVITIDCNSSRGGGTNSNNIITQFTTSIGIMMASNSKNGIELSDIVILPNTKRFSSLNIQNKEELIQEGYIATKEKIKEIEKLFLGKLKKR